MLEKHAERERLFFITFAIVAGLALLGFVSEPRRTAQVSYATSINMVAAFVILAVIFLVSSYIFLRKPLGDFIRNR